MLDNTTKRQIDSARDILVGKVPDPKAQIDQITTAMIYKFMDDMDKEAMELGGKARFFADNLADYSWTKLMDTKLSGDERINIYKEGIEKLKIAPNIPELFRNIFKNYYLPFYDQRTLSLFLKEINEFSYDNSENLGNAFEYLLSILGSQGDAGQFRTPRHIIDFIVAVVDPKKNETILDPACGTAGFLISAYKHIIKTNSSNYKPDDVRKADLLSQLGETATETIITEKVRYAGDTLTPDDRTKLTQNIAGYDIDSNMVKLALVNLYLHGFPDPKITEYDTLSSDKRWDENFDVILANPPFMTPKGGIVPHKRFSIQANRAEVLFVDYIAEHLSIKGRAGIIVPEGIIFQSANAYKNLRKNLIENWGLYAVVSLPSGVFQPYSGVKTSILLLDREVAKRTDEILFLKVENDGFDLGAQRRKIDKNDLPDCLQVLHQWKKDRLVDESAKLAFAVKKEKIITNSKYDLTSSTYCETIDYSNAKWEMVELGEILELSGKDKPKENDIPVMSITMHNGLIDQSDKFKKRIASADTSNYKKVYFNELVVGFPIDEGVLGFQTKYEAAAVSPAYDIWKLKIKDIHIPYLEKIFRSDQAREMYKSKMQGAVSRRRSIPKNDFIKIKIPLPPLAVQEQIVAEIEQYQKVIDGAKQVVANWKPSINLLGNANLRSVQWEMVELGEVIDILTDYTANGSFASLAKNAKYSKEKDYAVVVRLTDLRLSMISDDMNYVSEDSYKFLKKSSLFGGEYLIANVGANIGDSYIMPNIKIPATLGPNMYLVKFNKKTSVEYIQSITQQFIKPRILGLSISAAQPKINKDQFRSIKIPLPPLAVQEQIVAEIEAEQRGVDECKKLIEKMQKKVEAKIGEVWGS